MSPFPPCVRVLFAAVFITSLISAVRGAEVILDLGSAVSMDLIEVPAGKFTQGSPTSEAGRKAEEIQREVSINHGFLIGKTPVTRGQFARFVGETGYKTEAEKGASGGFGWTGQSPLVQRKDFTWKSPGFAQTDDHPVVIVTFNDAKAFAAWLSKRSGRECRLPTEAEWEYSARAGSKSAFATGNDKTALDGAGWYLGNSGNGTKPVAQKAANAYGIFDMNGLVWEWCEDWFAPYSPGPQTNPLQSNSGLSDKPRRVLRGGSWLRDWTDCRAASRYRNDPQSRNADNGFRIVASLTVAPPATAVAIPATRPSPNLTTPVAPPHTAPPATPRPPVDVEKFALDPMPSHAAPLQPPKSTGGGFFVVLAGGAVAIFWALRGMFRRHIPLGSTMDNGTSASGRPVFTRIADDGFWIEGDAIARGSSLLCRYTAGGEQHENTIAFEPGPEGHFVFTGARPTHVSVVYLDEQRGYSTGGLRNPSPSFRGGTAINPPRRMPTTFNTHPPAY